MKFEYFKCFNEASYTRTSYIASKQLDNIVNQKENKKLFRY